MAPSRDQYNDVDELDPSRRAVENLNTLIDEGESHEDIVILDESIKARADEESPEQESVQAEADTASPETPEEMLARDALRADPVLQTVSERDSVRLLIFTRNGAMRQLGSLSQKRILELGGLFAEIHVIILTEATGEMVSNVRLADNVWLYSTESSSWWMAGFDAYRIANEQLVFAGGFRADTVIAEDPFESGLAARFIARKYDRPFQVHILDDIFDPEFHTHDPHNGLRLHLVPFVMKYVGCVRTASEYLRGRVTEAYPLLAEYTEALPLYYNLEAWRDMTPTLNLKDVYPQFKFIVLHVTRMQTRSHTAEVVQGVAPLLRMYPTIGLVIVGNGPLRGAIEKQVIELGIHGQVEFEPVPEEVISHMKSANVLVHLSEDPDEDTVVLEAATVKLPMIASTTSIAGTLLTDSESAFLCSGAEPACVRERLRALLNDNLSRTQFAMNAQEIVFERIEQDYLAYLDAYRSSVERCI